jgi:hypothetical protein
VFYPDPEMCFISGRTLPFKVATTPIRKGVKKAVNQSPRLKQMSTVQVKEKWSLGAMRKMSAMVSLQMP